MKTKSLITAIAVGCFALGSHAQTFNNVGTSYPGTPPPLNGTNAQLQTAQDNQLIFQGDNVFGSNALRNNIKVGIGVFNAPINGVVERLHLNDITASKVAMRMTNLTTGPTITDGFALGVNPAGEALLVQEESHAMRFYTTALERMRIQPNGYTGINTIGPGNRLELNTINGDPYFIGTIQPGGSSGLKFTNLTSVSTPLTTPPTNNVLSVDGSGNVILIPGSTSSITGANDGLSVTGGNVQLGGLCGSGLGALLNTREVPMAGFNINYTMPALSPSQILIGVPACTTGIGARVAVFSDTYQIAGAYRTIGNFGTNTAAGVAGSAQNLGSGNATGLAGVSLGSAGGIGTGVNGTSTSTTSNRNYGLHGAAANGTFQSIGVTANVTSSSSSQNYGVTGNIQSGTNTGATNYGFWSNVATSGLTNYGLFANVSGGTSNNYGVYANAGPSTGNIVETNYAGFFVGDVVTSGGNILVSDRKLKKDVKQIGKSIDIIKKLNPVSYSFDLENHKNLNLSNGTQYGFISQEVKDLLPELTTPIVFPAKLDNDGKELSKKEEYLGLNYNGFIAIMVDALKQQQTTIENQQKQIDELKALVIASSTDANTQSANRMAVNLSDKDVVVLNQNQPNPFAEQTVINYSIPQNAGLAQLVFYDASGRQIKTVDITTKGTGQLNVFANDLTNGIYSYTLVVDGKVIDTKKMVKQQ